MQLCIQVARVGERVLKVGRALRTHLSMGANHGFEDRARALIQLTLSLRTCKL